MAPFSAKHYVITDSPFKRPRTLWDVGLHTSVTTKLKATSPYRQLSGDAPYDVLREIFSWATIVDDPYEIRMKSPFDEGERLPHNMRITDRWKESMRMRRALPLVCTGWADPARPFVLEHISCNYYLESDYKEMARCIGLAQDGSLQLGKYVKSLTFKDDNRSPSKIEWAIKILHGCPHLRHVKIQFSDGESTPSQVYLDFVRTAMRFCNERLLFLEVDMGPWFDEGVMLSSLHFCKNLHVLRISSDAFGEAHEEEVVESPAYSNLHTIRITSFAQNRIREMFHFSMSNLCHLRIFGLFDVDDAMPFFAKFGRQLRSLEFTVPVPELEVLLHMCENLEDIVLSLTSLVLHAQEAFHLEHDNVGRVGVRNLLLPGPFFTTQDMMAILDELAEKLIEGFTNLTLVRFIDLTPDGLNRLKRDPEFAQYLSGWIERLSFEDIDVQDANGVLLATYD